MEQESSELALGTTLRLISHSLTWLTLCYLILWISNWFQVISMKVHNGDSTSYQKLQNRLCNRSTYIQQLQIFSNPPIKNCLQMLLMCVYYLQQFFVTPHTKIQGHYFISQLSAATSSQLIYCHRPPRWPPTCMVE